MADNNEQNNVGDVKSEQPVKAEDEAADQKSNLEEAPKDTNADGDHDEHDDGDDEADDVDDVDDAAAPATPSGSKSGDDAKKASKPRKEASYSFREAAITILKENGPLSAKELTQRMIDQKMIATAGKTPDRTVAALMYSEIKQKGKQSAFYLPTRGVFGLTECAHDARHKAVEATGTGSSMDETKKKRPRKSKKDAAAADGTPKRQRKSKKEDKGAGDDKKKKKKKKKKQDDDDDDDDDHHDSDSEKTEESDSEEPKRRKKAPAAAAAASSAGVTKSSRTIINTPIRNAANRGGAGGKRSKDGDETYNDDYGYMYLRYFLDLTRRQEESDFSPEDDCFICKNGGDLICCDFPDCSKVYHLSCLGMSKIPAGKWYCPTHYCAVCEKDQKNGKASVYNCATCTNAYCEEHLPPNLKHITKGYIICKSCMPYFLREIDE